MMKYIRLLLLTLLLTACDSAQLSASLSQYSKNLSNIYEKIANYPYKETFSFIKSSYLSENNNLYKDIYKISILCQPDDITQTAENIASLCKNTQNCNLLSKIITNPVKGIDQTASIKITIPQQQSNTILNYAKNIKNAKTATSYTNKNNISDISLIKIEISRNYYSNLSYFKNLFYSFAHSLYLFGFIPMIIIAIIIPWFLLFYTIKLILTLLKKEK